MSGSKTNGPTLAITDSKGSSTTVGSLSFNSSGSINTNSDYVRKEYSFLKFRLKSFEL